jgi:hypothetical protein
MVTSSCISRYSVFQKVEVSYYQPRGLSQDYFEVMIEGWDSMHFAKGNVFEIQVIQSHINSAIFGHLFYFGQVIITWENITNCSQYADTNSFGCIAIAKCQNLANVTMC